jgi:hypothetical protein
MLAIPRSVPVRPRIRATGVSIIVPIMSAVCLVLAGCGSAGLPPLVPSPELVEDAARADALEAEVEARGAWPAAQDMLPEVHLFTPRAWTVDGRRIEVGTGARVVGGPDDAPRRETVVGPEAVVQYLELRRSSQLPDVLFEFSTGRILVCDGAVIQVGTYPVRVDFGGPGRTVEQPFTARWVRGADHQLRLETLWMTPTGDGSRPARLASGCREGNEPRRALRISQTRFGLTLNVPLLSPQPRSSAEDAVTAHGGNIIEHWSGLVPTSVQGYARVTPRWQGLALLEGTVPGRLTYREPRTVEARYWSAIAAALVVAEMGPARLGAGPALGLESHRWEHRVNNAIQTPADPVSERTLVPGALVHGAIERPFQSLVVQLAGQYRWFSDSQAPGYFDLEQLPLIVSGPSLYLGLGYRW